ncbi:hypothetical protein JMJ99_08570 [Companilactobacillus zhachilii]|nr:hypothetical protein [Companilactobacillus zhachilii]MBL3531418.1 hypothetical protein [Companilactobacillus zhachilii]
MEPNVKKFGKEHGFSLKTKIAPAIPNRIAGAILILKAEHVLFHAFI